MVNDQQEGGYSAAEAGPLAPAADAAEATAAAHRLLINEQNGAAIDGADWDDDEPGLPARPQASATPTVAQTHSAPSSAVPSPPIVPRRHRDMSETQILEPVDAAGPAPAPQYPQQVAQPPSQQQGWTQQSAPRPAAAQQSSYTAPPTTGQSQVGQRPQGQQYAPQGAAQHQQQYAAPQQGQSRVEPMSTAASALGNQHLGPQGPGITVTGWRAFCRRMGLNVGPSSADIERAEVIAGIRSHKEGFHLTGVLGQPATRLTAILGQVTSRHRPDAVVAIDGDPDGGDLADITARNTAGANARTLIHEPRVNSRNTVDQHLAFTGSSTPLPTNLSVLASLWQSNANDYLEDEDIYDLYTIFKTHYSVGFIDAGKGLQTPTAHGVLESSRALVLPAAATNRGIRVAANTVDWLRHKGYHGLLANTIIVVVQTKKKPSVTYESFESLFQTSQKLKIHFIPFDSYLYSDPSTIDIDKLEPETLEAFEDLAAMVASTYNSKYVPPVIEHLARAQAAMESVERGR